ncbi:DUF1998 domain-containing protein, partial [Candidatus Sumerlaeota bacterium]|nr:DUF1998 domain-containing protein [Candidatus Sumerlaeota bacterium]
EHPEYLFGRPIEQAVVDLDNPCVVSGHLRCAASELPIAETEQATFGACAATALQVLEEKRKVKRIGDSWYHASSEVPQHELSLRAFSEANVMIVDAADNDRVIGEVDVYDAPPLVHPGAIYMHQGETYEVERLDLERNMAFVRKVESDHYTQPLGGADVDHVDKPLRSRPIGVGHAHFGEVTCYFRTYGYEKIRWYTLEAFSIHRLDLPVQSLETLAFWIEPPEDLMRDVLSHGLDALAGLRGLGYAIRMALPLFVSAETLDFSHSVGSRNTPWHVVFVYERHPRGLGYVEKAYEILEDVLETVYQHVRGCPCQDGCPCCVGKPLRPESTWNIERGEGSIPSRPATLRLLEGLLGKRAIETDAADVRLQPQATTLRSDASQRALPVNIERAIRRRLERQREAKALHRVEPKPETGYPMPERAESLSTADSAQRARHLIEASRRKRKERAAEKGRKRPTPPLPEKADAAQPPDRLPEVEPRRIAAQADDLRKQMMIASAARRQIRRHQQKLPPPNAVHE